MAESIVHYNRRVHVPEIDADSDPARLRHTYSIRRFRLVVALLTLVMLPVVVGSAFLIYEYLIASNQIEARLKGERWLIPSRLYARPLVLHNGLTLQASDLVKRLNGLNYEEKSEGPARPGEFVVGDGVVAVFPRTAPSDPGAPHEPLLVTFERDKRDQVEHIKEIRGRVSRRPYRDHALEPELMTYLFDENREKRRLVRYADIPDNLKHAVLAIEDRRFFSHPGLDPFRLIGAVLRNLRNESSIPQGGSTLSQQLVKNYFLRESDERGYRVAPRTFKRKTQEALLAFVLERRATKEEILELYLNEIYLGQVGSFGINGVGQAARLYFGKDVGNLTLAEAALLAGLIQSPNRYHPYKHPDRAKERRDQVLHAMVNAGFIDSAAAQAAIAQPLHVQPPTVDSAEAPYFVDLVREQLAKRYAGADLVTQNLTIYTSLDLQLQALAQAAMRRGLQKVDTLIKRKGGPPVQGCLIALEPATGAIVALVGGRSYGSSQYNRVTEARRQPGSTFKPFVYLTAFEASVEDPALPPLTPATVVDDSPTAFLYEDKEYTPENYERKYFGNVTLRRALAHSLNVATVKVGEIVGFDRVADMWTKRLGMSANVKGYPALALGSFEATPMEMAIAYDVLANGGLKVDPVTVLRVTDDKGRTLEEHRPQPPKRVVSEESAFLVTNMLRSVLNNGTAAAARAWGFSADAAGKTGTTNDMRDAWFAGYTPGLLCVVWVGFDDNTPINLAGSRAALPIWVDFMKNALAGVRSRPFSVPADTIVFVDICNETGLLATPHCPKVISESFLAGTVPTSVCGLHQQW
jgi:penicillin-binding protein 1B